jgi:drug/metabolite transporter (DMT)-like permease
MLGAGLALLSALSFSLQNIMARRGVAQASASAGAFITIWLGVPIFFVGTLVSGQILKVDQLSLEGYGLLAAAGAIHFVVGRSFNYRAIAAIGAARAGPISALTTPYSILIAIIFLDESITLLVGFGIVCILLGPIVMVERRQPQPAGVRVSGSEAPAATATAEAPQFEFQQARGYLFAGMSAMAYGTSPVFIRGALEGESGLSVLGGLVSYTAAALIVLVGVGLTGRRELLTTLKPATVRAFVGAGFFVAMAQMLRFMALSLAPVAVVTSLNRAGNVFTLGLSWTFNRHLEFITPKVVAGVIVSVIGAILLVIGSQ